MYAQTAESSAARARAHVLFTQAQSGEVFVDRDGPAGPAHTPDQTMPLEVRLLIVRVAPAIRFFRHLVLDRLDVRRRGTSHVVLDQGPVVLLNLVGPVMDQPKLVIALLDDPQRPDGPSELFSGPAI